MIIMYILFIILCTFSIVCCINFGKVCCCFCVCFLCFVVVVVVDLLRYFYDSMNKRMTYRRLELYVTQLSSPFNNISVISWQSVLFRDRAIYIWEDGPVQTRTGHRLFLQIILVRSILFLRISCGWAKTFLGVGGGGVIKIFF